MADETIYMQVISPPNQVIYNPSFAASIPFVTQPKPTAGLWEMRIQSGTIITVSAPGYAPDQVNPGTLGANLEHPLRVLLFPLVTWAWTQPSPLSPAAAPLAGVEGPALWKAPYEVAGSLLNSSQTETLTAEFTLTQIGPWQTSPVGAPTSVVNTQSATIPVGQSVSISFGQFSQAWPWMDQVTGFQTGPMGQLVSYSLSITLTGSAGGPAGNLKPPQLIVAVDVSGSKLNDQALAESFFIQAVGYTAAAAVTGFFSLGVGAAVLSVLAFAAQEAEQDFANSAQDPPEPRAEFQLLEPFMPHVVRGTPDAGTRNVSELISRGLRVAEAERVLAVTEGRMLGARLAQSREDINRQLGHYRKVVTLIRADSFEIEALGQRADEEFIQTMDQLVSDMSAPPDITSNSAEESLSALPPAARTLERALRLVSRDPDLFREVVTDIIDSTRRDSQGICLRTAQSLSKAIDGISSDELRVISEGA